MGKSTSHTSDNVAVVVLEDAGDEVGGRNAVRTRHLGVLAQTLDKSIRIVAVLVKRVVVAMNYKIDLVLVQILLRHDPWRANDELVHVAAMIDQFGPL